MNHLLLLAGMLLALLPSVSAQTPKALDVATVLQGGMFPTKGMGAMQWLKDGEGYSRLEHNPATGGTDIVRYEAADNKRSVMIPSSMLIDKATGKPIEIYSFGWSGNNKKMLIFNNTVRVWRQNTKGDYWVLTPENGKLQQLGKGLPASSLMFAKFSPEADKVAYVSSNNLYVEDLSNHQITQLTSDGNNQIVNGTFDWVYEEEFDCRDGFRWSGDGKYLAYWQSDTKGTGVFNIINNVDSIYPSLNPLPYPKAGTTNSAVKVGYIPVTGGATTWIPLPGDPRNNYIPRMEFIPGTNELFIQQMNRRQNTNKVWTLTTGKPDLTNIFTDTDEAWLNTNDDIQWFRDNQYFTWLSERDGYRHIYLISRDGKEILPVTQGDIDVAEIVGMDKKGGFVYFIASPENFTQRYLYRARFFGKGEAERISPADEKGTHRYNMSPTGTWAVHTFDNSTTPPVISMTSFPKYKTVRIIEDNKDAKARYDAWGFQNKEFVKAELNDVVLDAWMIKPRNFDPAKKYPVIVEVYGEPGSATVSDTWAGGSTWQQLLAEEGYIVMSIENRGAKVPRGRAWRKCIYGAVGLLAAEDQANALKVLAGKYPFIDLERVGITGHSGGGSMTLHCMFRFPELYRTGIALAFVADQKTYDSIYQERYMDTPQNNPEGYRKGSPINYTENLQGNLLIIHGTGDDNVHYQNCELLVNELVRHGKMFSQLSYPMRTHSINEGKGTYEHLKKSQLKYWKENLPAGAR